MKYRILMELAFELLGASSDEMGVCNTYCSKCSSHNLTWCVRVNDMEVISIAQGYTSLEFLW
ncbi:hypothetical protein LguiA_004669 [Lonicera macranthoides]